MGDQAIQPETAQPQESAYRVLKFVGEHLPKDYEALIYSKWLRSLRHGNDFFRLIEPKAYYTAYHNVITKVLSGMCQVWLAALVDDPDVVLGFSVSRGTILDYVYVQPDMRRLGVGKNLVPAGIDTITHLTKTGLSIWGSKYGKWRFNPFT